MGIKKGEIYFVELDPVKGSEQGKTRPAVIIQHNALNEYSNTTIIVPISSKIPVKKYSFHVSLTPIESNLKKEGVIKVEQIRSIDKSRIGKKVGCVSSEKLNEIAIALQKVTDFW